MTLEKILTKLYQPENPSVYLFTDSYVGNTYAVNLNPGSHENHRGVWENAMSRSQFQRFRFNRFRVGPGHRSLF